jgi:hypothetical protein
MPLSKLEDALDDLIGDQRLDSGLSQSIGSAGRLPQVHTRTSIGQSALNARSRGDQHLVGYVSMRVKN